MDTALRLRRYSPRVMTPAPFEPPRRSLLHRLDRWFERLGSPRDRAAGLETCPVCRRDFVNPVDWEAVDEATWWMLLRCGECDTWREVTVANDTAMRYDVELDRRADAITRAAQRLESQQMAAEVETLITALQRDLIDAADFAR